MFDFTRKMTLNSMYAAVIDVVGNANTLGISPICDEQSDTLMTQRLYDWEALYESLLTIANGLRDGTIVSVSDIL